MPAVGDVIAERYRLENQLGAGAMGSVWRATHVTLGSEVAIKIIKASAARNPRSLARFQREAVLAAKIESAHVVRITDHGHHEALPFIVMDHLVGEDLRQRLQASGSLSIDETAMVIRHACLALTAAHAVGLVHRDIKPENLFITPDEDEGEERLVVLDFGVAKASDTIADAGFDATETGTLIGTPYYLSPEQTRGDKSVGPPADMWSLAVVAFECITGERPFDAPSIAPLLAIITHGAIPAPSQVMRGLPPAIDAWFRRALTREPTHRFPNAKEMSLAFEGAVATAPQQQIALTARESASHTIVLPENDPSTQVDPRPPPADASTTLALPTDGAKTLALPDDLLTMPMPPPRAPHPGAAPVTPPPPRSSELGVALAVVALLALVGAVGLYLLLR